MHLPSVPSAHFWKASAPGQTLMDGQLHLHLAVSHSPQSQALKPAYILHFQNLRSLLKQCSLCRTLSVPPLHRAASRAQLKGTFRNLSRQSTQGVLLPGRGAWLSLQGTHSVPEAEVFSWLHTPEPPILLQKLHLSQPQFPPPGIYSPALLRVNGVCAGTMKAVSAYKRKGTTMLTQRGLLGQKAQNAPTFRDLIASSSPHPGTLIIQPPALPSPLLCLSLRGLFLVCVPAMTPTVPGLITYSKRISSPP